ncbi:patatin-like phospholipase family protein [Bacillus daqingensis]|uniref:Patatin-like phospholipase family protein n=2 Tax=Bacillus daqingensis TaxID=872396 RepID=A0ABV9NZ48_9BACI
MMKRFNLAFSGGGFRAAFFCLGAYSRFVELGVHEFVSKISSVSGGSITAAVIMKELWHGSFTNLDDFKERVEVPLREFGRRGFRNHVIRNALLPPRRPLRPVLPRARFSSLSPITLDNELFRSLMRDEDIVSGITLDQLPDSPEWECNATNLHTLKRLSFSKKGITDEVFGYSPDVADISVAAAVAASAAFPFMFEPVRLDVSKRSFSNMDQPYSFFLLSDGGVYDNLGSEAFLSEASNEKDKPVPYLILDASARKAAWSPKERRWWGKRQWRILSVSMDQVAELRKKLIRGHDSLGVQLVNVETMQQNIEFQTTYWNAHWEKEGFGRRLELPNYETEFEQIERMLANVRTDLDAFSEIEIGMLMWAGAMRADLGCRILLSPDELTSLPGYAPRHEAPSPWDYLREDETVLSIKNRLTKSHKRRLTRK